MKRLDAQPTGTVTVQLSGLDATEGSLSINSLSFTPDNWKTPQQVIVTGLSDGVRDGDITYTLNAKAQPGGGYAGTESTSISITNQDNNKRDLYLLLDTSTSMRHRGGKNRRKFNPCWPLRPSQTMPNVLAINFNTAAQATPSAPSNYCKSWPSKPAVKLSKRSTTTPSLTTPMTTKLPRISIFT